MGAGGAAVGAGAAVAAGWGAAGWATGAGATVGAGCAAGAGAGAWGTVASEGSSLPHAAASNAITSTNTPSETDRKVRERVTLGQIERYLTVNSDS